MKENKVSKWIDNLMEKGKKESPAILTGLGVLGLAATAYAAYKAGLKASIILEKHKKAMENIEKGDKEAKKEATIETVKSMTPVLLPPIIMGVASAACIIGSNTISSKRVAVLSAAYSLSERTVKDLNGKMTEILGEKKTRQIKDAITKDRLQKDDIKEKEILLTGSGDVLCKDYYSGRFFRSSSQKVGLAVNKLSVMARNEMYVSLNDFYDLLNIPRLPLGEDFGWIAEDTESNGNLPINLTAILTEEGVPCLCIDYEVMPRADFRDFHSCRSL